MRRLMVEELKQKLDNNEPLQLVDIRDKSEFEEARIEGSINIPRNEIKERYNELDKNVPVVIICRFGTKSSGTVRFLTDNGFDRDRVFILDGGIYEWACEIDTSLPAHLL
ncbi:MAG: rhodanese-like domain-containing protein [Bacteroidales bacterium]|nr:rhodanese-like domain-containing protein [Bacteroidales bacterium]MCF8334027.1 rhodanese-like domain-containing protein [Bacteroidales bacterium]